MELFRTDLLPDGFVFCDLDTVFLNYVNFEAYPGTIVLRDFFRGGNTVQSSLMKISKSDCKTVWKEWMADPEGHMMKYMSGGDQAFLEPILRLCSARWQDVMGNRIISSKTQYDGIKRVPRHVLRFPKPDADIVIFHGQPRPWKSKCDWIEQL